MPGKAKGGGLRGGAEPPAFTLGVPSAIMEELGR